MGEKSTNRLAKLLRFLVIFLYTIFVGIVIYSGIIIQEDLRKYAGAHPSNVYYNISFLIVFPIVIGVLLAIPYFLAEVKKSGTWRFDWIKFLATGAPAFLITYFR